MDCSCVFEKGSFHRFLQTVHSIVTVKSSVITVNSSICSVLRAKSRTPKRIVTMLAMIT